MRNLALRAATWAVARRHQEEGQTFIEYALVIALVSIVLAAALIGFGEGIIDWAEGQVTAFTNES